jgi:hypothetical protein
MVRTGKIIPKEIIFPIIQHLQDSGVDHMNRATWTNIYNSTLNEKGKRYTSNDIGFTLEHYLEKKLIEEQMKNKQTRVFSIGKSVNDEYQDFLKNVTEAKRDILKQHVEKLDHKQIFTNDGGFVVKNHEDFTKFMIALEDSAQFYTNLLDSRENAEYDGDSMTGLSDNPVHEIFNEKITHLIKLTVKSIEECCVKLKYGKEQDERTKINGMLDNITWFLKV